MPFNIDIERSLMIYPGPSGGVIHIPGVEPNSENTSDKMWVQMAGFFKGPYITVHKALSIIPGSKVRLMEHWGLESSNKMFIFPAFDTSCPCQTIEDWYWIMTINADYLPDDPEADDECSPLGMGDPTPGSAPCIRPLDYNDPSKIPSQVLDGRSGAYLK